MGKSDQLVCSLCLEKIDTVAFPFCSICREPLADRLKCDNCRDDDGIPVVALGTFVDPLRTIIHQFKYHGFRKLARLLAETILNVHGSSFKKIKADCLIPVPLHSLRMKSRGFNQAGLMADILGNRIDLPVCHDLVYMKKKRRDQTRLDPARRMKNVAGAFDIRGVLPGEGRVIIVDDVITTGATLREVSRVIKSGGGKAVLAAFAAVTRN